MYRCVHNADVYIWYIMCIGNEVCLYSTLCVLSICMCILHIVFTFCTLSSVQSVNMYCPYVILFIFFHCLEHARKNFTHQGTCAVVM